MLEIDLLAFARWPQLQSYFALGLYVAAFYLAYRYGMAFSPECASPFWFPDSVLLCALLLSRPRKWWIFLLLPLPIRLLSEVSHGIPLWFLLVTFAIDSAKGLFAAAILQRFAGNPFRFQTTREFSFFFLVAALLVPALAAIAGATARHFLGHEFWPTWEQWFFGNMLAQLIVTPAILYWLCRLQWHIRFPSNRRVVEACVLALGLILSGYLAFGTSGGNYAEPRFYAPVPFLFWAAIRFGMSGASSAIMIIAFFSVGSTLHAHGSFRVDQSTDAALTLQQFLLLRAAPLYLVAILIEQSKSDVRLLRESEAQNRVIFNSLISLVVVLDRWGYIVAANEAWRISYRLGGAAPPGIDIGVNYLEVCCRAADAGDSFSLDVVRGIEGVLAGTRKDFRDEYACDTPIGTRWFELLVLPLMSDAGGAVVKHLDITDRKLAEQKALLHRDELARLSRVTMLGELSGSLAHELNQPLGAILINAQAAERMLERETPDLEALREVVHDIVSDDRRARDVIERLRLLYRKGEGVWQNLDLNEVIGDTLRLARGNLTRQNVELRTEYAPDLPPVTGDRVQLQQVLLNLLTNAIHAMERVAPVDRRILVRTERPAAEFISVSVSDRGCGIPTENIDRIFQPFFTTQSEGSGLGLSVCRTIIAAHHGSMVAENNPGAGATIRFTLPCMTSRAVT
ncbi:hypothetical protein AYO41_05300 [Verrucomicrobia bacterium SCGC AG-212-E04]|nr:hypothetical protein AYO41_05300 [Verrucomicrobia bacterium SCGC AG-212-E04]